RIAIARAILNNPKLILADEPTGNLDAETSRLITELLHKIVKEQGVTVMMITHNLHLVERYPERTFECKDKALVEITHANKKMHELQAEIDDDKEALDENADADMEIIEDIEHLEEPTDIEEEDNDEQEEDKGEKQKPAYHEADFEILEDLE
ncbi:MAG: hypothetical protein IJ139_03020, partial [Bacteroidaceae bacterium]|nr:hypothetical protein [Bacteroidaceae bacterium]